MVTSVISVIERDQHWAAALRLFLRHHISIQDQRKLALVGRAVNMERDMNSFQAHMEQI